jgi:hypothetical protein
MPFICSVLKPFGDLSSPEKQQSFMLNRKSKSYLPYFFENLHKYQSEFVCIDTLLNQHLSILPFKSYFDSLYKISEIFNRLDFIINEFDELKQSNVHQQLVAILAEAGFLTNVGSNSKEVATGFQTNQAQHPLQAQASSDDLNELASDSSGNKFDLENNFREDPQIG